MQNTTGCRDRFSDRRNSLLTSFMGLVLVSISSSAARGDVGLRNLARPVIAAMPVAMPATHVLRTSVSNPRIATEPRNSPAATTPSAYVHSLSRRIWTTSQAAGP